MEHEARSTVHQLTHLTVLMDLRPEEDRHAIDSRLERIMHTLAKASADISPLPIAVDRRKQAKAVDDDAARPLGKRLAFYTFGESNRGTLQPRLDSTQVLLVDLVRR